MTKKSRTILFFILTGLFLTIAPGIALYSWGYRFDIDSKKIVQTGAFYFKVVPRSAQVYLEGKQIKRTDFFFGAVLIENLLPKKYEVEIKKDGFYPWRKTLEIKERGVTDAKNIVLVPQNPEFSILTKKAENLFFSPDGKKVVLKETSEDGWALKLLELERNVKSHLVAKKDILKTEVSIFDLNFSSDSKRILLKTGSKEKLKYTLIDLEKSPIVLVFLDFLGENTEDVFFHPTDGQKLFLLKNGDVFEADLFQKKISPKILENIKSFQVFNKDIYYLLDSGPDVGFLFKTDFSFSGREKINKNSFSLNGDEKYKIYVFSDKIFLQDERNLYLFNPDLNDFEKFFETTREPEISSDFKKIVYYSDYEIWILFLKDEFSQPQKSAGEREFLARFSEKIGNVFWLTGHYLIFNSGSKIKIAEIDDRDKINIVDLADFKDPEIFFNQSDKKLYILIGSSGTKAKRTTFSSSPSLLLRKSSVGEEERIFLEWGNLYSSEKIVP